MDKKQKELLLKEFPILLEKFKLESDRGVVLVVTAMVENELKAQLTKRLLAKAEAQDELLSNSATSPISTFSSKINLAFRIGLITNPERTVFHQLRKIRNRCAHEIDSQHFGQNHFKDHMRNIINAHPDIWDIMSKRLVPSQIAKEYEDVEHYLNELGWRVAFEAFFGLIIAHKRISKHRILPIIALSKIHN
ncbi:hypothetical protein [Maribacter sp. 4G9]|uniref:hypothetical protein n=1 Tax=Maribacter sp. 4G9 TaxID=1889777 RepID=UPI000C161FA6|nr:hypothetical protein [Maribacter sp. 4G9]PIB38436.1 hypothetical protein BFP75_16145 [Maribacter sp. 4G9]